MKFENSVAVKNALEQLYLPAFSLSKTEIQRLASSLKGEQKFALACQLLSRLRKEYPSDLRLGQECALCTYKNEEELTDVRLSKAIKILKETEGNLKQTKNLETLGLLGSIHKLKWIHNNQIRDLRTSRYYYHRAYSAWIQFKQEQEKSGIPIDIAKQDRNIDDNGFNAINTIYLTDTLAFIDIEEARKNDDTVLENLAMERMQEANVIRRQLIHYLPEIVRLSQTALEAGSTHEKGHLNTKLYWLYATLAEAHFGLHEFEEAADFLSNAQAIKGQDSWEYESFARQLASLAQIHSTVYVDQSKMLELESRKAIKALINSEVAVEAIFIGKVGLALSGGGFRASLFHIGVLARLAEVDTLRHVEVLSCVSGGSIIGAYYYLEIKKLLEAKKDSEITQQDYIDLVKRIETQFVERIQKNLRTRIFGNVATISKLLFSGTYSTSERMAELYEKYLYKPLLEESQQSLRMADLKIKIPNMASFKFKRDNWKRRNKIPNLIINATPLNTGHNWQFTASWMGEPPGSIIKEVDAKTRLRRLYYKEAPAPYGDISLGQTVAASSGVPGVIEPLIIDGLYKNDVKVQLVDGGVHDNQGIVGLLAQECQVFLVSDASGQLNVENKGLGTIFGILTRSNSIMMERIRECEFMDLKSRLDSNLIKGMMFVHLRKDLDQKPLGWVTLKEPPIEEEEEKLTNYGINKDLQRMLASMRTDLDAFNDRESYALMYSAYQMTKMEYGTSINAIFKNHSVKDGNWKFMSVANELSEEEPSAEIVQQLEISQMTFNKTIAFFPVWGRVLKWFSLLGSAGVFGTALYFFSTDLIQNFIPFLGKFILVLLIMIVAPFILEKMMSKVGLKINTKLFRVVLTIFGVVLFLANKSGLNWLYLQKGKVKKMN